MVVALTVTSCARPAEPLAGMPRRQEPARVAGPTGAATGAASIDWSTARWSTDDEVEILWRSLGLDGTNWLERLETIPREPPMLRHAMAAYHLRREPFTCPVAVARGGCAARTYFLPPAATADVDDPCLGRELALWALDQIDERAIDADLYHAMVALIAARDPERELNQRALDRLAPGSWFAENALWESMAAGNDAFVEANLERLPADKLQEAASTYSIDAALLALDPGATLETHLEALANVQLRDETRVEVARRLVTLASSRDGHAIRGQIERAIEL